MDDSWKNWVHITKLDPDKVIGNDAVADIATSGTDALMLSGTLNVTQENMRELIGQVKEYDLPIVVEPGSPDAVVLEGVDGLFVPSVLNTPDMRWMVGIHQHWVKHNHIDWTNVVPEAYIVLNPASSVGKVTGAICEISAEDVAAYAEVADQYFSFPVVYIEYSGTYGNPAVVSAAADAVTGARLFYGGGINSAEKAAEMGRIADTIVVGNAVYDNGVSALKETVKAVK